VTRALLPSVALALAGFGCTKPPSTCGGRTRLEVRDGSGALQLRVAESGHAGELALCDPNGQRIGALAQKGDALVLADRGNAEVMRAATPATLTLEGPRGEAMRLFRAAGRLRVLRPDGVAFGELREAAGRVNVLDVAGTPVASVTHRDADAVVTATDGTVRGYLVPNPGDLAAGVLALPELPLSERVFIAAHVARGRLQP
jgi:hypothetical protein